MVWFKVDDGFPNSKPVLRIPRRHRASAIGLWTLAGAWSAKELTDGHIAEHLIEEFASTPAMARQLVACGLWEEVETGWNFRNWSKWQPTREQVNADREREAQRKRSYRASKRSPGGTTQGQTPGHQAESGHPDPTRPDPTHKPSTSAVAADEQRPEIEALCERLAAAIEANGSARPNITKGWRDAARLMLDKDARTVDQIQWIIDWCQHDEFWRANVLSMPTLRKQFDKMRLRAVPESSARPKHDPDWALA